MWLHNRKMKKSCFFEERNSDDFHIILLELAVCLDFWSKTSIEIKWKWVPLLFYDVKTSKESNDIIYVTIRCVYSATSHQKDEKVFFCQILMHIWRHFWPPWKFGKIFFRVQKKYGETCSKFKPSRLEKVLSMFFQKN